MSHPIRLLTLSLALGAAAAAVAFEARAGTVRYYGAGRTPDPQVVAGILGPARPAHGLKMRGLRVVNEPAAQPALAADGGQDLHEDPLQREHQLSAAAQAAVQDWNARYGSAAAPRATPPARATALALAVPFGNNSARLPAEALGGLDAVAEGMRQVGYARAFVIEGHTSATGTPAHNLRLSVERARSVKRYLVQQHGIPAAALRTVGIGPRRLLNAADPAAAENRRVQFRAT